MAPDLEMKATYGLVAPEEFTPPPRNAQWTADVYKAFDITKLPEKAEKAEKAEKEDEVVFYLPSGISMCSAVHNILLPIVIL